MPFLSCNSNNACNVSFNSYNNVTFAGRKNKEHHNNASNPVKVDEIDNEKQ